MSELCGGIEAYTARPLRARITECCFGFYTPNQVGDAEGWAPAHAAAAEATAAEAAAADSATATADGVIAVRMVAAATRSPA